MLRRKNKIVCLVQARMGSTRLPGKVLRDLYGVPMLTRVMSRCGKSTLLNEVGVVTTTNAEDDDIIALCKAKGWPYFRGSENDLLDRYYQGASYFGASFIVRVTSDCPLIDWEVIDEVIQLFLERPEADYVSNVLPPRTFPRGLDVELIRFDALEKAWREDCNAAWREHVTPFIYRHPDRFQLVPLINGEDYSSLRWTVDTEEDFALIEKIFSSFKGDTFSWCAVVELLKKYPEWMEINRHIAQKVVI